MRVPKAQDSSGASGSGFPLIPSQEFGGEENDLQVLKKIKKIQGHTTIDSP